MTQPGADQTPCRSQPTRMARRLVRHLRRVAQGGLGSVELRRTQLLWRLRQHLGPVQWEHLTDHCERVSEMARHIARVMNLPHRDVEMTRIAGLLHDIGKCMIPEALLAKPARLSTEEWRLMERHEEYGVWIARRLGLDPDTSSCIRHHHRRFDAAPIRGDSRRNATADDQPIPIGASILCAADALVTMLSERSYCRARSVASSFNELRSQSGRQFDPDMVEAACGAEMVARRLAA